MDVHLITFEQIKSLTQLQEHVTEDKIVPLIYGVQRTFLRVALGKPLYSQLVAAVTASALDVADPAYVELEGKWQALLVFIQPALAHWVMTDALPSFNIQLTDSGAVFNSGSRDAALADYKAMQDLISWHQKRADFYEAEVREYIFDNASDYGQPDAVISPTPRRDLGGLYLGGPGRRDFDSLAFLNESWG